MTTPLQSRRALIQAGAGLAATAMIAPASLAQAPSLCATELNDPKAVAPTRYKLSLAGYSFRGELDTPGKPGKMSLCDLVDLSSQLGLDGVEPTSYYFLQTDDAFVHALKRRAFLKGLTITGTPIRSVFNYEPGPKLDEELQHVRKWVDICVKLGSPVIRIFAGKKRKETTREQDFELAIPGMKKACDYAGEHGIYLAIENHGYLTESADALKRILEAVDHPWLGVNLDTGNFGKDAYENIAQAAPYAVVCQLKAKIVDPERGQRVPADFKRIFEILRQARYQGCVALEYEDANPHENVPLLIEQMKQAQMG